MLIGSSPTATTPSSHKFTGESLIKNMKRNSILIRVNVIAILLLTQLIYYSLEAATATAQSKSVNKSATSALSTLLPSGILVRHVNNPIVPMGGNDSIDGDKTGPRVVLKLSPTDYRMWYEAVPSPNASKVGYAISVDGKTWIKRGHLRSLDPSTDWEGGINGEVSPNSILVEDGFFKLWYHSFGNDGKRRIGYAISTDGLNWTKNPDPVLDVGPAGSLEDQYVVEPRVFKIGKEYRMYYTANEVGKSGIGTSRWFYATSSNGVNWTRRGQIWSKLTDTGFGIVFDGIRWHAWYGVGFESLNYASSNDGLNWTDGPNNPVLLPNPIASEPDNAGLGDSVSAYRDSNEFRIMYTGGRFNSFGRNESICLATIPACSYVINQTFYTVKRTCY